MTQKKNRAKSRVQKTKVIVIQKEKRQPGLFSFSKVPDPKRISGQPDISLGSGSFKKSIPWFLQKAGCKKTGSLLFNKRREQAGSSLFE